MVKSVKIGENYLVEKSRVSLVTSLTLLIFAEYKLV